MASESATNGKKRKAETTPLLAVVQEKRTKSDWSRRIFMQTMIQYLDGAASGKDAMSKVDYDTAKVLRKATEQCPSLNELMVPGDTPYGIIYLLLSQIGMAHLMASGMSWDINIHDSLPRHVGKRLNMNKNDIRTAKKFQDLFLSIDDKVAIQAFWSNFFFVAKNPNGEGNGCSNHKLGSALISFQADDGKMRELAAKGYELLCSKGFEIPDCNIPHYFEFVK